MTEAPKPKLLFVGAFPPPESRIVGGMVTACRALVEAGLADRVDLRPLDTTQISNPPPPLIRRAGLAIGRFAVLLRQLAFNRPDAVLLFSSSGASLFEKGAGAWAARLLGIPALIFPRAGVIIDQYRQSSRKRRVIRLAFAGAARILCQGQRWQDFAVDELGFERAHAPIIPNWSATPELLTIGAKRRPTEGSAPCRLIYVGWLEERKGVLDLIRASAPLLAGGKATLDLVGDGHARPSAEALVAELNIADRVTFHGWKTGAALHELLAAVDVFALPSWAEGLPNAMIEAMAAGLPVVVSDVGNISDHIVDGENGLLVQPKDIAGLQLVLERVVTDRQLRLNLGAAAYATASTRFAVDRAIDQIVAAVQDAARR